MLSTDMPLKPARSGRVKLLLQSMWRSRHSYAFMAPFLLCFTIFILIPVIVAIALSFTYFNAIQSPVWNGWGHYQYLLSQDILLLEHALPITLKFALIVGPGGYIASFILAWLIAQIPDKVRLWIVLAIYAPSLTAGTAMAVIWTPLLSGDRLGYLNSLLLKLGWIDEPQLWTLDKIYLMDSMIAVTLWSSAGIGFLAMLAGILNVNPELYEAARIDGINNRLQEVWYITIPAMKPQMLFAAVMAIVGAFKAGNIGVDLSGQFPTPQYAGHTLVNHIEDYGLVRFEMGYASALSVVLLIIIFIANRISWRLFGTRGDEG
ncbi:sugar ABC transporter permease [Paenibacillus sp. J5C2022]|uniref:carbohydrate ABC transporter permease n=1 Tax=Paenibacillus sp. J5C2022 TaxID=2977129 RepID=UPI00293E3783|nr:sugar ABC transporter permease [Paenibacillus sp. J5C2022]